jgi:molecular chaperone Hsp33
VQAAGEEKLGHVSGLLIQALPDGDRALLRSAIAQLRSGWLDRATFAPEALLAGMGPLFGGEVPVAIDEHPAVYHCPCSRERALRAITAMGREEIADLWEKEGKAEATCEFCGAHYVIPGEELLGLIFPANAERN